MSRLTSSDKNKRKVYTSDQKKAEPRTKDNNTTICIGTNNVKLWTELRTACKYTCDEKFTSFLLNLAQKHLK